MSHLAPIYGLDPRQYQSLVCGWLIDEVATERSRTKALAAIARAPLSTAKHWTPNGSAPEGIYMCRLRASLPNFDAKMRELEGRQADLDPEFPRLLNEAFMQALRSDERLAKVIYERFFSKPAIAE